MIYTKNSRNRKVKRGGITLRRRKKTLTDEALLETLDDHVEILMNTDTDTPSGLKQYDKLWKASMKLVKEALKRDLKLPFGNSNTKQRVYKTLVMFAR